MKIKDAINSGIKRIYDPRWLEKNAYIRLPEKYLDGRCSAICKLFSDETQQFIGAETPQIFLIHDLINGDESECVEYNGKISDKDTD